jgi:uncharacterized protein YbaA (DUF1428 family)
MSYVDGFVMAVPSAKKDAYLQMAKVADAVLSLLYTDMPPNR